MKRAVLTVLLIMVLSAAVFGQAVTGSQVPAAVKNGLREKFQTVKKVEWKIKADRNYEAEFTLKKTDTAAKFDSTGKWLETESAAPRSAVPSAVRDSIAKQFKRYKIIEIQTVQRWNEQRVIWEIHLEGANEIVKAQFDASGAILSRSAKPKSGKEK